MRIWIGLMVLGLCFLPGIAEAEEPMQGPQIGSVLTGNSLKHPDFPYCIFYESKDRYLAYDNKGVVPHNWWIRNDNYFSTWGCGDVGCKVYKKEEQVLFLRKDGRLRVAMSLMKGNQCKSGSMAFYESVSAKF